MDTMGRWGDGVAGEIELKDVSHPVFLKMLEFLYTDQVRRLEGQKVSLGHHPATSVMRIP